jgi:hypothetical protein
MSLFDQEEFDENKDYLTELTGPGGKFDRTKYASEQDMYKAIAKGKVFADKTLDHKLQEFDELREDFIKANANANASTKYDELKALLEKRSETDDTTKVAPVERALDPVQIDALLDTKLAQLELRKKEETNLNTVETRLRERYGENANAVLRNKMNSLGMSVDDLKFLARRSPEVAINALGLNAQPQETYQSQPTSTMRSDNFSPQVDIRDAVYYEKMRKEKPKEYFSEKVSIQRLKDMDSPDFLKRYRERST